MEMNPEDFNKVLDDIATKMANDEAPPGVYAQIDQERGEAMDAFAHVMAVAVANAQSRIEGKDRYDRARDSLLLSLYLKSRTQSQMMGLVLVLMEMLMEEVRVKYGGDEGLINAIKNLENESIFAGLVPDPVLVQFREQK